MEVKKLMEALRLLSNRELVTRFIQCLTESFKQQLHGRLSAQTCITIINEVEPNETSKRRKEDMYNLEDVIKTALDLAYGAKGFGLEDQRTRIYTRGILRKPKWTWPV